ncbi:reverse transcriptase domain-containing protein, partial [Tanacetum coccineum]
MATKKSGMSVVDIEELITQRVTEALTAQDSNRDSGNHQNSDTNSFGGGECTTRVCTYKDFLNCQPLNFKGTEWTVGLAHWFKKMKYVFHIRNCTMGCKVKYATCTLLGGALTWWNSHVRNVGHDAAYGIDVENYTRRFQELIPLCSRMVPNESDKVEKYTGGLPDSIQGSVMPSKPKLLQEAIELARNCRSPTVINTQRAPGAFQKTGMCFECRSQGHYKKDCQKLKNTNRGNHTRNGEARGRAYALGGGEPNPGSNVVT